MILHIKIKYNISIKISKVSSHKLIVLLFLNLIGTDSFKINRDSPINGFTNMFFVVKPH